jgi:hypothetical protein
MHRRALLSGLAALAACGPRRLSPPPAAPRIGAAAELIPADLDVVARLDMGRMKAALGGLTPELVSRDVLARTAGEKGDEPDQLVVSSLLEAELVYLGYRPSPQLLPLDRVLALQGRFEPLATPPGFSAPVDLGADLRYWERLPGAKPGARSAIARIYALGERVRAFVSEAEIDAVERNLEGLAGPRQLLAPEEGSLSLSLRPRLLGRLTSGTLRELLEESRSLDVVLELDSDGGKLRAALVTAEPAHAEQLAKAGRGVLDRALGDRAGRARLDVVGERLSLSLTASRAELSSAFGCLREHSVPGAGATECPW